MSISTLLSTWKYTNLVFRIPIFEIDKSRFGNMQVSEVWEELLDLIDEIRVLRDRVFDMHVCKNGSAKKEI